jgi:ribosomal protein S18 acetylase RimI-like enzyme
MRDRLPVDYALSPGSVLDRSLLVKFMQRTYQELYPDRDFSHLAQTVDGYFSSQTPLWWVKFLGQPSVIESGITPVSLREGDRVACLWLGNSVDQVSGIRHAHVFLLYVVPPCRRQGIGAALMHHAETWARNRGDRQIGLQVFTNNQPALALYRHRGYQPLSIWMLKDLNSSREI